jgi:hypothetical protein
MNSKPEKMVLIVIVLDLLSLIEIEMRRLGIKRDRWAGPVEHVTSGAGRPFSVARRIAGVRNRVLASPVAKPSHRYGE